MKITIFPGKYHQNCGFSMAMLVSGRVTTYSNAIPPHFEYLQITWSKAPEIAGKQCPTDIPFVKLTASEST